MENDNVVKLSKAILDMKFMKKSKERVEKEEECAEGQAMYSNDITEEMKRGGKFILNEVTVATCTDMVEGRLSFGGMNPEVERYMQEDFYKKLQQSNENSDKEKETEVSDFEMAKRMNPLVDTMNKKLESKKTTNKNAKNKKFVKPNVPVSYL